MVLESCDRKEGERANVEEAIEFNEESKHLISEYHHPQVQVQIQRSLLLLWFKIVSESLVLCGGRCLSVVADSEPCLAS